jgi:glucose/arabinose dehydrogenase/PKD repeat protein
VRIFDFLLAHLSANIFFNQTTFFTMNKRTIFLIFKSVLGLLLTFIVSQTLSAQLPAGFVDTKMQSSYSQPMGVVFSKDGKTMFVWEKKGTIWASVWDGTTYVKQNSATLDIHDEVGDWSELGFQSVALDPNFDSNGLIYMYYQVDRHHLMNFGTPQYSATTNNYGAASISRVTRYKLNKSNGLFKADNASRKILIGETKSTGVPLLHESHAGGQVVFGTDGTLFVSTGDNGTSTGVDLGSNSGTYFEQALADGILREAENVGTFRAQLLNSHCGKILRIDPKTGNGVPSNPHYDGVQPRLPKSRVWAMGLRNPYRITLKTDTGDSLPSSGNPGTLLVGDVQWFSREEVHIIEKGGLNCGWPLFEGIEPTDSYYEESANVKNLDESGSPSFQSLCKQATSLAINSDAKKRRFTHFPPALDWLHGQNVARYPDFSSGSLVAKAIGSSGALVSGTPFLGNCATSGTYYTGTKFPANFQKVFFFADYTTNWIKAAAIQDNSSSNQIKAVKEFAPIGYCKGVVDIECCPLDQSIFYVNINSGDIQRISYTPTLPTNHAPVAVISANVTSGTSPVSVNFSSLGSKDPDNDPLTYLWNFGDNTTSTLPNPSHIFTSTSRKICTVNLTVKDSLGLTDTKSIQISIDTPITIINRPFSPTKCYIFTAAHSLKVMQVAYLANLNGVNVEQYEWTGSLKQIWRIKAVDSIYYRIVNGYSGNVVDVKAVSMLDTANIQVYAYNGGGNQLWKFEKNTKNNYVITAKHSGKVIDVKSSITSNNTNIQQFTRNDGLNQQWQVAEIGCPAGTVAFATAQIYTADGYRDGQKAMITWLSNAADADYFQVEKLGKNGSFETLSTVNAQPVNGFSTQNYYSYADKEPMEGENIYRISLLTDNTPPQYSELISLNFKASPDFLLSPNPTDDYVNVDLSLFQDRRTVLTVIDAWGKQVKNRKIEKVGKTERIELDGLPSGQYVLRIQAEGRREVARLFVIAR